MQAAASPTPELVLRLSETTDGVQLAVLDRGPGLPADHVERLFEPFYTTRTQGLGLGLNICRSIAESLGGALQADNRPGGGAVFTLTLPRATPEERT
jgi:signal transduction histidine kinase